MLNDDYTIRPVSEQEAKICVELIRKSFATVAEDFGYTKKNAPSHTSFITMERWKKELEDGRTPYCLCAGEKMVGYVALLKKKDGWFDLNHLAVLPGYRHHGYGAALLSFSKGKVKEEGGEGICLTIVEENARLKKWYIENGFISTGSKKFEALTFTVGYMEWRLEKLQGDVQSP